jgi:hypothetical protein
MLRHACLSVCPSVRMEQLVFHCMDFNDICYFGISLKLFERITVSLKSEKNEEYFTWRPMYLLIEPRSVLKVRNTPAVSCGGNQNAHCMFNNIFFFENRDVYDTMWENTVERGRPQMAMLRMRTAFLIPKATNTHSEYVISVACPPQQCLQERASFLGHTYIACPFKDIVQPEMYLEVQSGPHSKHTPSWL